MSSFVLFVVAYCHPTLCYSLYAFRDQVCSIAVFVRSNAASTFCCFVVLFTCSTSLSYTKVDLPCFVAELSNSVFLSALPHCAFAAELPMIL